MRIVSVSVAGEGRLTRISHEMERAAYGVRPVVKAIAFEMVEEAVSHGKSSFFGGLGCTIAFGHVGVGEARGDTIDLQVWHLLCA